MKMKKTTACDVGNPGPGLGRAKQFGGLIIQINEIPTLFNLFSSIHFFFFIS